ncbi:hypothetical protein CKA55_03270 [Arcobacter suis]|uniref:Uncharacterized protein n=1 Tax=Arcobacter suis CECT 7833 TaxID=663365 RepID=A0AAD0WPN5_9BACT|nr:hypothetical protein [Arcobacter suis]AXX88874.1 hypothetical protein ASUIS_0367 [Arcobacter suis CECT 7833]RWS47430.1 hypothetical protein CKA55_03270 [Arcobacter suis]
MKFKINIDKIIESTNSDKINYLDKKIKKLLKNTKYLLTGPIYFKIDWFIEDKYQILLENNKNPRYIKKPLIDLFIGIERLLIDDSQIDHLKINIHSSNKSNYVIFKIEDLMIPFDNLRKNKKNLYFIELKNNMFLIWNIDLNNKKEVLSFLYIYKLKLNYYYGIDEIIKKEYFSAFTSIQQDFHKTRLTEFRNNIIDITYLMKKYIKLKKIKKRRVFKH